MAEINVDCTGEVCPVPLIEMRKALRRAEKGDIVIVTGNHPSSKEEIPMAVAALGSELLEVAEENGIWRISIRK